MYGPMNKPVMYTKLAIRNPPKLQWVSWGYYSGTQVIDKMGVVK